MEREKDNNGETVPTGLYIITVTVREQAQTKVVNVWTDREYHGDGYDYSHSNTFPRCLIRYEYGEWGNLTILLLHVACRDYV